VVLLGKFWRKALADRLTERFTALLRTSPIAQGASMSAARSPKPMFECPNCGAAVRMGAAVCRECGSDANTGWQSDEEVDYQSLDLPEGYGNKDGGRVPDPPKSKAFVLLVLVTVAVFAWIALRR
jgi:predicted RNA-binding Zn-ribbon protein involved in translation (DUF1610 family)